MTTPDNHQQMPTHLLHLLHELHGPGGAPGLVFFFSWSVGVLGLDLC